MRIRPDVVLCSTARRARETLDGITGALGDGARSLVEAELYGAGVAELLARLRRLNPAVASVLLIGHNPALQTLILTLAGDGDDDALASVRHKFPTAALATVALPGASWSDLAPGIAYLEALFLPGPRR